MIRRKEEQNVTIVDSAIKGGEGIVTVCHLLNGESEMNGKGRIFCHSVLKPGDGMPPHLHEKESEIYYILSGKGEYFDNKDWYPVEQGDVTICRPGEQHALRNTGDVLLEFIGLVLFE